MDRWRRRSSGVSRTAVAEAREAPAEADLAFDRLYRTSRDDVYAYSPAFFTTARRPRK